MRELRGIVLSTVLLILAVSCSLVTAQEIGVEWVVPPVVFTVAELSADGYIRVKYKGKWGVIQNPEFDYFQQFERKIKY